MTWWRWYRVFLISDIQCRILATRCYTLLWWPQMNAQMNMHRWIISNFHYQNRANIENVRPSGNGCRTCCLVRARISFCLNCFAYVFSHVCTVQVFCKKILSFFSSFLIWFPFFHSDLNLSPSICTTTLWIINTNWNVESQRAKTRPIPLPKARNENRIEYSVDRPLRPRIGNQPQSYRCQDTKTHTHTASAAATKIHHKKRNHASCSAHSRPSIRKDKIVCSIKRKPNKR